MCVYVLLGIMLVAADAPQVSPRCASSPGSDAPEAGASPELNMI